MNQLETPTPAHKLGDVVGCKNGGPPWQRTWGVYRIDGMKLEIKDLGEVWDTDDGPYRLEAEQPAWRYLLVVAGTDKYGNETADEFGWVIESEIQPAPEPVAV